MKNFYFTKLVPPRASFATDMTEQERALMGQHSVHMQEHFAAGTLVLYGPVMAAAGAFGVAVFQAEDEGEVRRMMDQDPTVVAGLTTYEVSPMHVAAARGI